MSSLTDSICSGGGGTAVGGGDGDTDDGSDGESDLDLLRDEDGKSDGGGEDDDVKSNGGDDNDGIYDGRLQVGVRQVVVEQLMSKQSRCGVT
ncbi:hypothetical protein Tco_0371053 [Tanacetum coccineum]